MQEQNNQPDTTIYEFDNLPAPPALDEQLLNKLDSHIKGHWTSSHQCVTMIRSICKQYPQYIPDIFTKYGPAILDFFSHNTTILFKNVLKLLMEVFSNGVEVNLQGCVQAFLPPLAKKAAMDSCSIIKEMCQQVLTVIASKCCYCNTIESTSYMIQSPPNLVVTKTTALPRQPSRCWLAFSPPSVPHWHRSTQTPSKLSWRVCTSWSLENVTPWRPALWMSASSYTTVSDRKITYNWWITPYNRIRLQPWDRPWKHIALKRSNLLNFQRCSSMKEKWGRAELMGKTWECDTWYFIVII